jgi:Protein of unknown function (DUF3618)
VPSDKRGPAELRQEIETEREQLASAVDDLRENMDPTEKLRAKLPAVAAGALAGGFVLAGGIGATFRLLFRRGREGSTRARVGRFKLVDRS